jgi:hypothetical protein
MRQLAHWTMVSAIVLVVLCVVGVILDAVRRQQTPVASTTTPVPAPRATARPVAMPGANTVTPVPAPATPARPAVTASTNTITLGKPLTVNSAGMGTIYVPVTNAGGTVKSFTIKATYKNNGQEAATAPGPVADLLPGQTRAIALVSADTLPEQGDTIKIEVDRMIADQASTPGAEIAKKISFGPPKLSSPEGFPQVDVAVTNGDNKPHSLVVQAMFMQGGILIGVATGDVDDLQPGQTQTAALSVQGATQGGEIKLAVDTLVQ